MNQLNSRSPEHRDGTSNPDLLSVNNSELVRCTEFLLKRAEIESIFAPIKANHPRPTRQRALLVGTSWYLFSNTVGEFLSRAAAAMSDNIKRFTLVQILWEELGEGKDQDIHADMFYRSILATGITEQEIASITDSLLTDLPLPFLKKALVECQTEHQVLGLCAGVEAPAKENIEMIHDSLAHDGDAAEALDKQAFFKLHRAIEDGHINLGTLNFIRFCKEPPTQAAYLKGFDEGVQFWKLFWHYVDTKLTSTIAFTKVL